LQRPSSLSGSGDARETFPNIAVEQERDMKIVVMFAAAIVSTILVLPTVAQAAVLL
jgi:hypothetical protein